MVAVLEAFLGWETGGLEEAASTVGTPTVGTANARSGSYALLLAGAVTAPVYTTTNFTYGSGDLVSGLSVRTTTIIPTNDTDFFQLGDDLATIPIRLRLKAVTGNVDLIDANNAVAGTITAPFTANTTYFIELYWQNSAS